MKPWHLIDTSPVPDGTDTLQLWQRDTEWSIRLARGGELMNSRAFGSERALAELVCPGLAKVRKPRVLVGGLGLGHTVAAALAALPPHAEVVVAELVPAVVHWNRGPLGHLADHPLDDERTRVHVGDVAELIASSTGQWDAMLLDVDNGPDGLTRDDNQRLYSRAGLTAARRALRPGGTLAVWSAHPSAPFFRRLRGTNMQVTEHKVRARAGKKGGRHTVWLASRPTK
ncbi:MAG: hypothetical protein KC502_10075 [Myxococcales bacterium]|nr:hypothetical protein [Myxococcales bacterium]